MRYLERRLIRNDFDTYEGLREDRGVKSIRHFRTPVLKHPTVAQIRRLSRLTHIWKTGDRYYKLAYEYYGSSRYWWIIAWYNKKPTESHIKLGQTIYIPQPLEDVMRYLGV